MFTIYYVRKEWVFLPLYVELQVVLVPLLVHFLFVSIESIEHNMECCKNTSLKTLPSVTKPPPENSYCPVAQSMS